MCGSIGWSLLDGRVACRELGFDSDNADVSMSVVSRYDDINQLLNFISEICRLPNLSYADTNDFYMCMMRRMSFTCIGISYQQQ